MWPLFLICIQLELVSSFLHVPSLARFSGSRGQNLANAVQFGSPIFRFSSSDHEQQHISGCRSVNGAPRHAREIGANNMVMAASGAVSDVVWVRPPPRGSKDIVFGGRVETSTPVQPKHDPGCDVKAYMMLPADQYILIPLPNRAKLERLDAERFQLMVPELQFFNVWVRPRCVARVQVSGTGVVIEATECRLEGSPEVERLDLNSKFDFSIRVVLTWREDPRGLRSLMIGRSEINVWVDPPQIFRLMFPRPLMEQTGNAVLRTSLNLLQATFMDGLSADFARWATDAAYRDARRAGGQVPRPDRHRFTRAD